MHISHSKLSKALSQLMLMSFGAVVLSSCTRGEAVSAPSPATHPPAVSQQASGTEQAADVIQEASQPSMSDPAADAETVIAQAPIAQAPPAPTETNVPPADSLGTAATDAPDLEVGLPYIEARTRLIQQGWVPVVAAEPGSYGVERQLYDMGITEVSACSGSGVGACRFEFSRPERSNTVEGDRLSVITYGGSKTEVADWELGTGASPTPSSTEVAIAQASAVPVEFQGLWNFNLEECAVPYSEGRLLIEPKHLAFYESSGPVVEVSVQGPSEVVLTTEMSGEGSTWTATRRLQLDADGSSLMVDDFGPRYRCSDAAAVEGNDVSVTNPNTLVPAQFQGMWNASLDECSNDWSEGRLLIESDFVSFYESSGPVVKVATNGNSEMTLTVELSGEGSTWMNTNTYQLSADGSSMTRNGDPQSVRYRCS